MMWITGHTHENSSSDAEKMTFTVSIAGEIGRFRDLAKAGGAAPGGLGGGK
jgi:hypothetical protein